MREHAPLPGAITGGILVVTIGIVGLLVLLATLLHEG
jgi:putative membrane protein